MDKTADPKPTILVLHETVAQSWLRDASAYALTLALIGTGWAIGSAAMQWLAFLLLVIIAGPWPDRHNVAPEDRARMIATWESWPRSEYLDGIEHNGMPER